MNPKINVSSVYGLHFNSGDGTTRSNLGHNLLDAIFGSSGYSYRYWMDEFLEDGASVWMPRKTPISQGGME
jgi:hypothetical protein